jgi:uncharacterized protein (DUF924 family)
MEGMDETIKARFSDLHEAAAAKDEAFSASRDGRLSQIILLDQFSRNIFRHEGRAFAFDGLARELAREAIDTHHDDDHLDEYEAVDGSAFPGEIRMFLYMPFQHSEDMDDQRRALKLFERATPNSLAFAKDHFEVVERFGRYPSRNEALGRESTAEEIAFLRDGPTWGQ